MKSVIRVIREAIWLAAAIRLTAARLVFIAYGLMIVGAKPAVANTTSPPVLGIDVYAGNGTMNWSQIASNGIQFAWAKGTQGNYYTDAQLPNNESGATASGVYVGTYDFADPTTCSPLTEATYFVNYASANGAFNTGKLLPVLDMESVGTTINGAPNLTTWINNWAADVYNLSGVHPLIYCSPGFFNGHGITSTGVPLWEADWTFPTNLSNTGPPSNSWSPWSTWTFWQYSDKGSVGGDPSPTVDLDAFNGALSQMIANAVIPALVWTGNVNGTWNISSSGTQNWNYGTAASNAAYYFDGRAVVFQDTNPVKNSQVTNSSISISSTVTPQSMQFTASSVNY
ncbi:MAG TPA: glycoside hydrolase family 25 protein, partial [Pirellulales bacterium]|nr:glycoside hydrolase family 25 protein [Pirellulales bacterium]